jgi:hypothetical protein
MTTKRMIALAACVILPVLSSMAAVDPAMQDEVRLARLIYDNSSGEKAITIFEYNEKGQNDRAIWKLEDGSRYSLNLYAYDEKNNLIRKEREYSDHKNTVQLYKYDQLNRLISEEFVLQDTSRGISTFEYDDKNQLVLIHCRAYNGWINGLIKIYYLENGLREKGELIQQERVVAKIHYGYDEERHMTSEIWEFTSGWRQSFIYDYEKPQAGAK